MKAVYLCHPYSGDPVKNRGRVAKILEGLSVNLNEYCFIATQLYFYHFIRDEEIAMRHCLELLRRCDEVWVFGRHISKGMRKEIALAIKIGIPVHFMNGGVINEME